MSPVLDEPRPERSPGTRLCAGRVGATNAFFRRNDREYFHSVVPVGADVLALGCGNGELLAALAPSRGVGLDGNPMAIADGRARGLLLDLQVGDVEDEGVLAGINGPFDFIILADTVSELHDCEAMLRRLHPLCHKETRLVIAHHSPLWEPMLKLAERLRLKDRKPDLNWFTTQDVESLCELADFEVVTVDCRQPCPVRLLGIGIWINRILERLPGLRLLGIRRYVVARSLHRRRMPRPPSLTVVVPCRNERNNVLATVERTPTMCPDQELIFVEGHSVDGTWEEIQRVQRTFPERRIRALRQPGEGKADAVWTGFDAAQGDLLMILDGDLTVPPEALPKFYRAITEGYGECAIGTRLVYPVQSSAMRFLNYWANRFFARIFSWLLRQRITDTLCGTKVVTKASYERMKRETDLRDLDPFGDFALILGAARQRLRIVEIPVRYAPRSYGETQIARFRHGLMLARMLIALGRRR